VNDGRLPASKRDTTTPVATTVFVLYLPSTTTLTLDGGRGYPFHGQFINTTDGTPSGTPVYTPFVVVPFNVKSRTATASHELVEVATNPEASTAGYAVFDPKQFAWTLLAGRATELADACEYDYDAFFRQKEPSFDYQVQRTWSNAAALAGKNPCVPANPEPYFNVAARDRETFKPDAKLQPTSGAVEGYEIAKGDQKVITLDLYSTGPTDDWTLTAVEGNAQIPAAWTDKGHLDLSLDGTLGRNGNHVALTVKVKSPGSLAVEMITIVSTSKAGNKRFYPILIHTSA
jgi:hypothetical protein